MRHCLALLLLLPAPYVRSQVPTGSPSDSPNPECLTTETVDTNIPDGSLQYWEYPGGVTNHNWVRCTHFTGCPYKLTLMFWDYTYDNIKCCGGTCCCDYSEIRNGAIGSGNPVWDGTGDQDSCVSSGQNKIVNLNQATPPDYLAGPGTDFWIRTVTDATRQSPGIQLEFSCPVHPTANPTTTAGTTPTRAPTRTPTGPTASPSPAPSAAPSSPPSAPAAATPSAPPTVAPSSAPSVGPSLPPTAAPSQGPSAAPSLGPTAPPSRSPTQSPLGPTLGPSISPSAAPTLSPSAAPTSGPSASPVGPSPAPSVPPSPAPSLTPSVSPSGAPSTAPTASPVGPTAPPSTSPSLSPSAPPTAAPSVSPSNPPAGPPTSAPSTSPTSSPSTSPTTGPTASPTASPVGPTRPPSSPPSLAPSTGPTAPPSQSPTQPPAGPPSAAPTSAPSSSPSISPTSGPTAPPTAAPVGPSWSPSSSPSLSPSVSPTAPPSQSPTQPSAPSSSPSISPTSGPTAPPTAAPVGPSWSPSSSPSLSPSVSPTAPPSQSPTQPPAGPPSAAPSAAPSSSPSISPTSGPTTPPTNSPVGPTLPPVAPSLSPSMGPAAQPSQPPTQLLAPSAAPAAPSAPPSAAPAAPSAPPTLPPSGTPSAGPSAAPTPLPNPPPSRAPSGGPSPRPSTPPTASPLRPSAAPSSAPSLPPSYSPTPAPAVQPTAAPSLPPSAGPSASPSSPPTLSPSDVPPSAAPSLAPSAAPSLPPTRAPVGPSAAPSAAPSAPPKVQPTTAPWSSMPSRPPSLPPLSGPSGNPSWSPVRPPTRSPTPAPALLPSWAPSTSPSAGPSSAPTALPRDPTVPPSPGPTAPPEAAPTAAPYPPSPGGPCPGAECTVPPGLCFYVPCDGAAAADCVVLVVNDSIRCRGGGTCFGGLCVAPRAARPPEKHASLRGAKSVTFEAYRLRGSDQLLVDINVADGTFSDRLGFERAARRGTTAAQIEPTPLRCGLETDQQAAVWLQGTTRKKVADACKAELLSTASLRLSFGPSAELVPEEGERLTVLARPGVMQSGEPTVIGKVEMHPEKESVSESMSLAAVPMAGAIPGAGVLSLTTRTCGGPEDAPPEQGEELNRVYNPLKLHVGSTHWGSYNGALAGTTLILSSLCCVCVVQSYLIRKRASGMGYKLSKTRVLEVARFGWLVVPLEVFFGPSTMVAATITGYGDETLHRIHAGVVLLAWAVLPLFLGRTVRSMTPAMECVPIDPGPDPVRCPAHGWFLTGNAEWRPVREPARFRLNQLLFNGYTERNRYALSLDLWWGLALAVCQAGRPQTSTGCHVQSALVLALLLLRLALLIWRRIYIAPFDNAVDVSVTALETVTKVLLIVASDTTESAAGLLTEVTVYLLLFHLAATIWIFVVAEYDYWIEVEGYKYPEGAARIARFLPYWFAFWGVVELAVGADQTAWAKQRKRAEEQQDPLCNTIILPTPAAADSGGSAGAPVSGGSGASDSPRAHRPRRETRTRRECGMTRATVTPGLDASILGGSREERRRRLRSGTSASRGLGPHGLSGSLPVSTPLTRGNRSGSRTSWQPEASVGSPSARISSKSLMRPTRGATVDLMPVPPHAAPRRQGSRGRGSKGNSAAGGLTSPAVIGTPRAFDRPRRHRHSSSSGSGQEGPVSLLSASIEMQSPRSPIPRARVHSPRAGRRSGTRTPAEHPTPTRSETCYFEDPALARSARI
eukprot:TRINITY_DN5408_c0_g1_i3.p1 TRINITY_DN5408_c0_g1~~TRINITY_DN5408_c0_g1_i3.p1  ORF type:complete len:1714 (+),score=226.30 TRINITY_DN5408_c0_g1_i3:65-5206(+)